MEVSNEIKEDIRKTQSDLRNAIRVHQIWVARLQEDENNLQLISKVKEAEKNIIAIGHTQKLVVDRLRRELELYQQRLKARNKHINIENDNRYVAQQLRDHQVQQRSRNRTLLKPSVLHEIHVKSENNENYKDNLSDSDNETLNEKENSHGESDDKYRNYPSIHESRNNFVSALHKFKEQFIEKKEQENEWQEQRSDSDSSCGADLSPTPSPPPLPQAGEPISQEIFMRLIGLVTPSQKEMVVKKRADRCKRSTTGTNRTEFLYSNYEMMPKRKKYNQFPYLQTHSDPPQTRSAKLRKQSQTQNKSSREGSPSGSSSENKGNGWSSKPAWVSVLPAGLTVEPVLSPTRKVCHSCGRNDVPSLLVWCVACSVWQHTGCGVDGRCGSCDEPLPDPGVGVGVGGSGGISVGVSVAVGLASVRHAQLYTDKLAERKRLQERNIELCEDLRKLEARAALLKENLDEHNAEKRQLLSDQIKTQRNLQKLLDFISQFKETSVSMRSTSASESSSDISKSNEE